MVLLLPIEKMAPYTKRFYTETIGLFVSFFMLSFLPHYTHIINPKLKHIYLGFDEHGELVIKSPKISQKRIEALLLKKSSWINNAKEKLQNKKGKAIDFSSESLLYYLGTPYSLHLTTHAKKSTYLVQNEESFTLHCHRYDEALFQAHIDRFYKEEAHKLIPPLVEKWSRHMQLFPISVAFRKTKRQWGSCSGKNALSFNTMMMKLPLHVIEYIIVHELAHIRHKHHQKEFWSLVQTYLPDYKHRVAELKTYR